MSLDGASSPSVKLNLVDVNTSSHCNGWGLGWYPEDRQSVMIAKDPAARETKVLIDALTDWSNFRSTVFFCKVRGSGLGYTQTETQPFSRSFAGRDWMFMHNGNLDKAEIEKLHGKKRRLLEPLGSTDSELVFCNLLTLIQEGHARRISDIDPNLLHSWFLRFDNYGSADMFLSDGHCIVAFQGSHSPKRLRYSRMAPPENLTVLESDAVRVALTDPRDTYRTCFMLCSFPFSSGEWTLLEPGQMIVVRRGNVVWNSQSRVLPMLPKVASDSSPVSGSTVEQGQTSAGFEATQKEQAREQVLNVRAQSKTPSGQVLAYRLFEVKHTTLYQYGKPVEHSTHVFRLQPTDDPIQEVVKSSLLVSSPGERTLFEDVFGNQAIHCTISEPYDNLTVEATSQVKIFAAPPDDHSLSRRRTSIPLVWMPWQRQMMMPYLLPMELPEPQLIELTEYAMSFAARNDSHLLRTLEDINLSIYRDYAYIPKSTTLNTTPFQVYATRKGVCQDFANLFICLCRLLSIPARYRMGYIYTGVDYANKIQSEASHAWAEVYLPYVGWRGFDPTNGCAVAQDHVRVACGRNYIDATPTSGTIYRGGGSEVLTVNVKMKELSEN